MHYRSVLFQNVKFRKYEAVFCFDIERCVKLCSKDVNFSGCKAEFQEKKNRRKVM